MLLLGRANCSRVRALQFVDELCLVLSKARVRFAIAQFFVSDLHGKRVRVARKRITFPRAAQPQLALQSLRAAFGPCYK
jgi:hypothetical protein